jgi:hypothetical protein
MLLIEVPTESIRVFSGTTGGTPEADGSGPA